MGPCPVLCRNPVVISPPAHEERVDIMCFHYRCQEFCLIRNLVKYASEFISSKTQFDYIQRVMTVYVHGVGT